MAFEVTYDENDRVEKTITLTASPPPTAPPQKAEKYEELKTFTEVLVQIEKHYIAEIPTRALVSAAIDGMLDTLDPASVLLETEDYVGWIAKLKNEASLRMELRHPTDYEELKAFTEVLAQIEVHYKGEVPRKVLVYAAIEGMVSDSTFNSWSSLLCRLFSSH